MRAHLKQQTDATHRRLDDAFGLLDLATYEGYATFLRAHQRSYAVLEHVFAAQDALGSTVQSVHALLRQDLSALGVPISVPQPQVTQTIHPLGTHYVLAGSHFGKRVLLKRWSRSTDNRVCRSGQYLRGEALRQDWPDVLTALSDIPADSLNARAIIESAQWTFELFGDSLIKVTRADLETYRDSA